jgi:serine/threonine protein kinase
LVLATAGLERAGIIHGDLSPNNIVIDANAPPHEPALYVIDFDAFVAPAAGSDQAIDVAEGGTYGTDGYCPPELGSRAAAGDGSAAPYSDRYGRDMLILELLFMDSVLSPDDPPERWNRDTLQRLFAAWQASCDSARWKMLEHLKIPEVFSLSEQDRPTSTQLAAGLGLKLPEMPEICTDVQISDSPSALPGVRSVSAHVQQRPRRRPAPARARKPSRQAAPARPQSLNRWLVSSAQVVTRTLRRTQKKPRLSTLPKDNLGTVVLAIVFIVLIWLMLFIPSCLKAPTISRSYNHSPLLEGRDCGLEIVEPNRPHPNPLPKGEGTGHEPEMNRT